MFAAHTQAIGADDFGDFCDRSGRFKSKIADNDIRFIHQNARALFQPRDRNARIDVAIVIGAANDDVRGVARWAPEKCADAIRRRSHFLDDFLKLLDHRAGFGDRFFVPRNFRA